MERFLMLRKSNVLLFYDLLDKLMYSTTLVLSRDGIRIHAPSRCLSAS